MECTQCCYSKVPFFLIFLMITIHVPLASSTSAQAEEATGALHLAADSFEWPMSMSLFDDADADADEAPSSRRRRRSLLWHRAARFYISYAALSADRIPCPPRSGRSYYTHNCHSAAGPVQPYTRGCSAITRCRS